MLNQFLYDKFGLHMNNDPSQYSTRHNITIDAVFSRYLQNIESQTYMSYFSYNRPMALMILCSDEN